LFKKIVFIRVHSLILVSLLVIAFNIQLAKANPTAQTLTNLSFSEQQILALINGSRVYSCDLELEDIAFRHHAFRAGGSIGANETANWIKTQFESFGLEAWMEPFEFTTWDLLNKPSFLIDDDGNQDTTYDQVIIHSFQSTHYSWPTSEEGIFADLVILPLPSATNHSEIGVNPINISAWDSLNTTGKVVLIGREVRWDYNWEQTYQTKLSEQKPAAVIYTWWYDWMSFTPPVLSSIGGRPRSSFGAYYWDLEIPTGFVDYEDGLWIRNKESATGVFAYVSIESTIGVGTHYNVVGKITGYENPEEVVIVSCHYDTVMCGGFCDNGAGTAGVIELARVFVNAIKNDFYKPKYTLLFMAFASEELGLVGSINYVKRHKAEMPNIRAVINLDSIGSDELGVTETNPVNGFDLDEVILNAAQDLGITATLEAFNAADAESFKTPSWANGFYYYVWGLEANISDATSVESSVMLVSFPTLYRDEWSIGAPGWIHTSFDNSTSTETLNWVEVDDLENHIKVAALTIMRITPAWKISFIGLGRYPIVDFAVYNGCLYAVADNNLYVYNRSSWNIINAPTYVFSLMSYQGKLVIGGKNGLYSYDGAVFTLVFTVSAYIKPLGIYNNTLYAGTVLDNPPTLYYCNGSAENPDNWQIDNAFSIILNFSGAFSSIGSFAVYDGNMYVTSGDTVYSFNGTDWSVIQIYDDVYAFLDTEIYNSKLYLATRDQPWRKPVYQGDSGFSGRVIEFDGTNWTTVFDHDYWMYSLEVFDDNLYAGTANEIYTYNGTDWNLSFKALDGAYYVISLITFNNTIYAGIGNGYIIEDPSFRAIEPETMAVPEFTFFFALPLFMIITLLSAIVYRKRTNKSHRLLQPPKS